MSTSGISVIGNARDSGSRDWEFESPIPDISVHQVKSF